MSDTQLRPHQWVDEVGDLMVEVWMQAHPDKFRWVFTPAYAQRYGTEEFAQRVADHINRVCHGGDSIATVEQIVETQFCHWRIKIPGDGFQWYFATRNPDPARCVPWIESEDGER